MSQTIGDRLRLLRESQEISQEGLAKKLGIERASLSLIENSKRQLKDEELIRLSKILNVTTDQILGMDPLPQVVLEKALKAPSKGNALRINVPAKNLKKFKEVLLYVLGQVGAKPNIGETVIYKLLYFIDFDYYEKYETQLTGSTYIKNHHGPTPLEFKKIVADMIEKDELESVKSQYFGFDQKKYLPHRRANLSLLSASEIEVIDDVLNKFSNMNAKALSEYSHKDVPWIVTENGKPIDYETVFYRTPPYSVREYNDKDLC